MRDNGIPEAQGLDGLDWFHGLAKEALGRLVLVRDQVGAVIQKDHFEHFMQLLFQPRSADPAVLLAEMLARKLDPATVACLYAPEAARCLGESWAEDRISFIDVTLCTEKLHALVRRAEELLAEVRPATGPAALVLVAEAEQHTLGAMVLALELRLAGFSVVARVAPMASEVTQLMAANRFDVALVSLACTAALESASGLVRTLRLLSRSSDLCIFVGGAIPIEDEVLLRETGADRVLRDVSALMSEFDACRGGRQLDRDRKRSQRSIVQSLLKGDGVDQ
jgi:methylmalonyl-CoA mutase cobalamin-binding domain/chain